MQTRTTDTPTREALSARPRNEGRDEATHDMTPVDPSSPLARPGTSDGLAVLDASGGLLAAEPRARRLLAEAGDDLAALPVAGEDGVSRPLHEVLATAGRAAGALPVRVVVAGRRGRAGGLLLDLLPFAAHPECFVVRVHDQRAQAAVLSALYDASQLRHLEEDARALLHDLRTPLNAVALNLQLLQEAIAGNAPESERRPEQQLATLDVVRRELERLDGLFEDFVARTRPSRGVRRRFDLQRLVGDVLRRARGQARRVGVRLARLGEEQALEVCGPRDRLEQALLDLVARGLATMAPGGTLTLAASRDAERAVLEVRDEGRGLAPAELERAFELHETTDERDGGCGLFVARAIVESMGGELRLEPAPQRGTTARLLLPLAGGGGDTDA